MPSMLNIVEALKVIETLQDEQRAIESEGEMLAELGSSNFCMGFDASDSMIAARNTLNEQRRANDPDGSREAEWQAKLAWARAHAAEAQSFGFDYDLYEIYHPEA
jgi:hypothetical protein